LLACSIAGCSAVSQPQTAARTEVSACTTPGHFCQTFFGP
jgi:hypothetical protein